MPLLPKKDLVKCFAEMIVAKPNLKNLFYDVVDAQYDVYGLYQEQCESFDSIQKRLAQSLEKTK